MKLAVVILNYQGLHHLQTFLPSVLEHTEHEVIVADNGSTDGSVEWLSTIPQVRIIQLSENYGFAGGYNEALKQVEAEFYLLLNSDVAASANWIDPLLSFLEENPEMAACQPKILDYKNPGNFEYAGASGGFLDWLYYPFCRGRIFDELEMDQGQYDQTTPVFWVSGACMLIRSNCFWEVGGFDADFFAHMEEIDLCWRLHNRGYHMACVPASTVYHLGGGTLQKLNPQKTFLNFRNNLFLAVKNDFRMWFFFRFVLRLLLDGLAALLFLFKDGWPHFAAIFKAHMAFYRNLGAVLRKRKAGKRMVLNPNKTGIYQRSILWAYYANGIKTVDGLDRNAFVE